MPPNDWALPIAHPPETRPMLRLFRILPLLAVVLFSVDAAAQSNVIPGTSVKLAKMDTITSLAHLGSFPNGINGIAMATTACNIGSVKVPWQSPMLEDHAMISFLVARENNGRFEQISDRSYVKHGFFALTSSYCNTCQEGPFGGGDLLGLGCSDTYKVNNNGDMFYLAPPAEIDPWLGEWDATCSYFDLGTSGTGTCDDVRSLSQSQVAALGPVGTRVNVLDADLNVPGADFFYQGFYTVRGEAENLRRDNLGHRQFTPSWNGSSWNLPSSGGSGQGDFVNGPIVQRWSGATVTSVANGNDDGRVYGAVKVTPHVPFDGLYRYEYVLQNRDNSRGIDSFSLPVCSSARILNAGFSDVDGDPLTDWNITVGSGAVTWDGTGNPLEWNTLYNFWFDSDAAPTSGFASLDQAAPGPGLATLALPIQTPGALYNVYLGDGCATGAAPELFATGTPPQATIGNTSFGLTSTGNEPGASHLLFMSLAPGSLSLPSGCTVYLGGSVGVEISQFSQTVANASGVATYNLPVPASPALEGLSANFQAVTTNTAGGPFGGLFDLTNGLRVRLGNSLPDCP
ncbi:MAG: hypothetical protein ACI84E_000529 [Planctomycetota bacterium]|jgi:hypothetical protein